VARPTATPVKIVDRYGVRNFGCTGRAPLADQAVARHRVEDPRLAEEHHHDDRGEAEEPRRRR
jgi:hypothetical protein